MVLGGEIRNDVLEKNYLSKGVDINCVMRDIVFSRRGVTLFCMGNLKIIITDRYRGR
jgi:hypothetical protein